MLTNVKTPQDIFYNPQRLLVPLFQRPYVWNRELQWQPLWDDVRRVATRLFEGVTTNHFLGAVVIQQLPNELGTLSTRSVIDGQQRLTTLQLMFDAIHAQLATRGFDALAEQVLALVENPAAFRKAPEDAFKVWPTNRDREAFNEVMSAPLPVGYSSLANSTSKMAEAHKYFSTQVNAWLDEVDGESVGRASALVDAISRNLLIVVIDLLLDEDAQEIFETLNARGTPLTAADLIKNFVFQRLNATPEDAEKAYRQYWEEFETPFWEEEVRVGRLTYSRSSLFLTQWLIAQLGDEISAREVFNRFKHYVEDLSEPVDSLLPRLHRSALAYRKLVLDSKVSDGPLDRSPLFMYRAGTLDTHVSAPLMIWLIDPDLTPIPTDQLNLVVASIESWMVRRAIVKATSKAYNRFFLDILNRLRSSDRNVAGETVRDFLASQTALTTYWPSDSEVQRELATQPIYKRLTQARVRMILESLEDFRRGYGGPTGGKFSAGPITRGSLSIEHVMPQEWRTNWPLDGDETDAANRDIRVHALGNLTLVTQPLNSKLSNASWSSKQKELKEKSNLQVTRDVTDFEVDWSDDGIDARGESLAADVLAIWPVPESNQGLKEQTITTAHSRVVVADLLGAGLLKPGQTLYCRVIAHRGYESTVSEDGGIFVDGERYETPSAAAKAVTKNAAEPGWWFWVTDLDKAESLGDLRNAYVEMTEAEIELED